MKLVLFLVILFYSSSFCQVFTKINTGAFLSDSGASRSVNWVDFNNDGYPDLFVSHGFHTSSRPGENNVLYMNAGPPLFNFIKMDSLINSNDNMPSDGSSWGDYNNDGFIDAFVVNWWNMNNMLYKNNGNGTFTQILNQNLVTDLGYSETCTWGDYDNDGWLDLYVSNSGYSTSPGVNFLYHNKKDGTFEKITTGEIVTDRFLSRGATWIDYDNDGDIDMYVVNERNQNNNLYKNLLKETGSPDFIKVTGLNIVTDASSSFSASWGDYNNDLYPDLFVCINAENGRYNRLYKNNGDGTFTQIYNDPAVMDSAAFICSGWGDFDNDGDLDLFATTAYGFVRGKNFLYKNMLTETGTSQFQKVTTGDIVNEIGESYGVCWGDYDLDGDLDIFIARTTNERDLNSFFRNENNNSNHWLEIICEGVSSNISAIGTKVRLKVTINGNAVWQFRTVEGQSGYCAQNLTLHFGLGSANKADSIIVEWPSGIKQVLVNVTPDRVLKITEDITLHVKEGSNYIPVSPDLGQNYPNPFNPSTKILFEVQGKSSKQVSLFVTNILGENVADIIRNELKSGYNEVEFSPKELPGGVYFYTLLIGGSSISKKK